MWIMIRVVYEDAVYILVYVFLEQEIIVKQWMLDQEKVIDNTSMPSTTSSKWKRTLLL